MVIHATHWKFTADQYEQMATTGILGEDDRVELINGEIVEMAAIGIRHALCVDRLNMLFARRVGPELVVSVQNPLRLGRRAEPQPDVVLYRGGPESALQIGPAPTNTLLVVEVADSSLTYDRDEKLPLYAAAGIVEVWIVDLTDNAVEIYAHPLGSAYQQSSKARRGETVCPAALPDLELDIMIPRN